jgi:DNA polymerase-3 subunit alpha
LANFTVVDGKTIRFGLKAIKGLGDHTIEAVIAARENGTNKLPEKFKNLEDFAKRVPFSALNKKSIEALAYSGALDDLGERKAMATSVDEIVRFAKSQQTNASNTQTDIFGMMAPEDMPSIEDLDLKHVTPSTRLEKLQWEKEYLGLFVSGHPFQGLKKYLSKKAYPLGNLDDKLTGKTVKICGIINRFKKVLTKSGAYMAYIGLEDLTGRLEIVIFPKTFNEYASAIAENKVVTLEGRLEKRHDSFQFIAQTVKEVSLDSMVKNAKDEKLFDEKEKYVRVVQQVEEEDDIKVEGPFVIELTEKMDAAALEYLKRLLKSNHGSRKVVINIKSGENKKTINVPFGVDVTSELKQKIGEIAK